MMNQPIHILNQMGVMPSFSVAKKVSEDDIKNFFTKQKKLGVDEETIGSLLREKIVEEIQEAVVHQKIPGLISPQELAKNLGIDKKVIVNIPELNRLVMVIAHKLLEKKYDKMSLCYFVNSLVNMLGLTESDFEKFHKNNHATDDDDGDDEFRDA